MKRFDAEKSVRKENNTMDKNLKIGVIGGDLRQLTVSSRLAGDGAECAVWGVGGGGGPSLELLKKRVGFGNAVKCGDWLSAVNGSNILILPLPMTRDGVRLNIFPTEEFSTLPGTDLRLTELINKTSENTLILGGKIPPSFRRLAEEKRIRVRDYYESEEFQIKNAVPTAEGAIAVAMEALPITLAESNCAIVGYGRIGRTLASRLLGLSKNVTCVARSTKDLSWACCDGCKTVKLEKYKESPSEFDVIFNTVPHLIFDSELLRKTHKKTLLIELASMNGGIDTKTADELGIKVIKAMSLPGKCSPESAGRIIYDSVKTILIEEGLM